LLIGPPCPNIKDVTIDVDYFIYTETVGEVVLSTAAVVVSVVLATKINLTVLIKSI
jgi:hypothetical protein